MLIASRFVLGLSGFVGILLGGWYTLYPAPESERAEDFNIFIALFVIAALALVLTLILEIRESRAMRVRKTTREGDEAAYRRGQEEAQRTLLLLVENKIPTPLANLVTEFFRLARDVADFDEDAQERFDREVWEGLTPPISSLNAEDRATFVARMKRVNGETLEAFARTFQPKIEALLRKSSEAGCVDAELEKIMSTAPEEVVEITAIRYLLERAAGRLWHTQAL
jgi:hypothetical protein